MKVTVDGENLVSRGIRGHLARHRPIAPEISKDRKKTSDDTLDAGNHVIGSDKDAIEPSTLVYERVDPAIGAVILAIGDGVPGSDARRNRAERSSDVSEECRDAAPTTSDTSTTSSHRSETSFDPTERFLDRAEGTRDGTATIRVVSGIRITAEEMSPRTSRCIRSLPAAENAMTAGISDKGNARVSFWHRYRNATTSCVSPRSGLKITSTRLQPGEGTVPHSSPRSGR